MTVAPKILLADHLKTLKLPTFENGGAKVGHGSGGMSPVRAA
ncbi:hypothetical protein [Rhodovulum sulfidophilum]|nr:hypothetical protein [Rhodovulum sulfidophilum]